MRWLDNRVPPPVVAACFAALAWLVAPSSARDSAWADAGVSVAALLAVTAVAITAAGAVSFRRARTTVNPMLPENASTLVTSGIYRYTRNPMYLGLTLALLGVAAWLWWLPALLAAAGFAAYITRFQIAPEERVLRLKFGDAYVRYCQSVRRWL